MDEEFEREIDEDFDWDDDGDVCDGCGRAFGEGNGCPMCCNAGGVYSPGTEECDWCRYHDECSRAYIKRIKPRRLFKKHKTEHNGTKGF